MQERYNYQQFIIYYCGAYKLFNSGTKYKAPIGESNVILCCTVQIPSTFLLKGTVSRDGLGFC
jgi:hypothetical protein